MRRGFTLIEILVVVVIMAFVVSIVLAAFPQFNSKQNLDKNTETIVETLRQARGLTLAAKDATQYGVHFASTTITLFTGLTYSPSDPGNQVLTLRGNDVISDLNLVGNGSDVVFYRLTGETNQDGTVIISSPALSNTRTVTIYKTGTIHFK